MNRSRRPRTIPRGYGVAKSGEATRDKQNPQCDEYCPRSGQQRRMFVQQQNRTAERQQRARSPCQWIDHSEIARSVATEQTLRVQQMQDTGGQQKEDRTEG